MWALRQQPSHHTPTARAHTTMPPSNTTTTTTPTIRHRQPPHTIAHEHLQPSTTADREDHADQWGTNPTVGSTLRMATTPRCTTPATPMRMESSTHLQSQPQATTWTADVHVNHQTDSTTVNEAMATNVVPTTPVNAMRSMANHKQQQQHTHTLAVAATRKPQPVEHIAHDVDAQPRTDHERQRAPSPRCPTNSAGVDGGERSDNDILPPSSDSHASTTGWFTEFRHNRDEPSARFAHNSPPAGLRTNPLGTKPPNRIRHRPFWKATF